MDFGSFKKNVGEFRTLYIFIVHVKRISVNNSVFHLGLLAFCFVQTIGWISCPERNWIPQSNEAIQNICPLHKQLWQVNCSIVNLNLVFNSHYVVMQVF